MRKIFQYPLYIFVVVIFCEYIIYPVVLYQCSWPELKNKQTLKVMVLADTHLLGVYHGHWFDKLRREWQMYRAFQTAIKHLHPELVVFLGDLMDEGQWANPKQFEMYVNRFFDLFATPENTTVFIVPGNHDIGFHYVMNSFHVQRFRQSFGSSLVHSKQLKGIHFVLLNSMALENDGCSLCEKALKELNTISKKLDCQQGGKCPKGRPILLQHFPMYRKSDALCHEPDEAPSSVKDANFREKWDCLSLNSSEMIYNKLNPRAIFTGHTHHGCHVVHRDDIHEFTVPSFSWRNKNNPTFTMVVLTKDDVLAKKCYLPEESTVLFIYLIFLITSVVIIVRAQGRRQDFFNKGTAFFKKCFKRQQR